jgi:GTP-binding protein
MPQTRFVLQKALEMKHRIIVVINKIDRPDARIDYVLNKTFDLFMELGADDKTADFPIIFSSGKEGKAGLDTDLSKMTGIEPLFDVVLQEIPAPIVDSTKPLQMLVTTLSSDPHMGRIAIGRIYNGTIKNKQKVAQIKRGDLIETFTVTSLMTFEGLEKVEKDEVFAGDIVAVSGLVDPAIGETIADADTPIALPVLDIEEPTIHSTFLVNDSPFSGKEGEFKTSQKIRARLFKELETDMALRVEDNGTGGWTVSGRGELHLAILIERLRREGYEFQVARPEVIEKEVYGVKQTPYEEVFIEVHEEHSGIVMQKMSQRRAELQDMKTENGITYMEFLITTKGLLGYRNEFITDTKGLGIINTAFSHYGQDNGYTPSRVHGSLIAHETGVTTLYGLTHVQDRGILFVGPAVNVYRGQVIGEHAKENDIGINVCKTKHLSNMRSKGDGSMVHFKTPRIMGLENALEFIANDELVEVTPKNIRIRKVILDEVEERKRQKYSNEK